MDNNQITPRYQKMKKLVETEFTMQCLKYWFAGKSKVEYLKELALIKTPEDAKLFIKQHLTPDEIKTITKKSISHINELLKEEMNKA